MAAQVKAWMIAGLDRQEMEQMAMEGGWTIKEAAIDKLIAQVGQAMRDAGMTEIDVETGRMIWRLNFLFKRSLAIQDYKTALAVQKEIADRCGLAVAVPEIDIETPATTRGWDDQNLAGMAEAVETHLAKFGKETDDFVTLIRKAGRKPAKRKAKK